MINFFKKIICRYKALSFDENEREFIESRLINRASLLVEMKPEHWYLRSFKHLLKKNSTEDLKRIGIWTGFLVPVPGADNYLVISLKKKYAAMLSKKWEALYRAAGLVSQVERTRFGRSRSDAVEVWTRLESKADVLKINYKGVNCGDLIYDSFLRFKGKATISIKSKYLRYLVITCFDYIDEVERIIDSNRVKEIYLSYATYVSHGVVARVGLKKGCNVYCDGDYLFYSKKLEIDDIYHTVSWRHYKAKEEIVTSQEKEERRRQAYQLMSNRLNGGDDASLWYMKQTPFHNQSKSKRSASYTGVVFLHDFFDSPHIYGDCIYADFYDWAVATLNLLAPVASEVAIKPHPNALSENNAVIEELKLKFPDFTWLDRSTSNKLIFTRIRWGISVYGTVLSELAFSGKIALSAGEHPGTGYNFSYNPKTRTEYEDLVVGIDGLKLPKNYQTEVADFIYMHFIHNKDLVEPEINLNARIKHSDSGILTYND